MDHVNRTLYIPLYGKACVSRKGILLSDPRAEAIWEQEGFPLKGKSRSKWLAYYMSMRAAVFDQWLGLAMTAQPDAVVLHLGCGMTAAVTALAPGSICGSMWTSRRSFPSGGGILHRPANTA